MNKKATLTELETTWSLDDLYRGLAVFNVNNTIDKLLMPKPGKNK